jgi:hypothetical protein
VEPAFRKISFGSECPKGHTVTSVFNKKTLQDALKTGRLSLFCSQCGEFWNPGAEERERIAAWLARFHS